VQSALEHLLVPAAQCKMLPLPYRSVDFFSQKAYPCLHRAIYGSVYRCSTAAPMQPTRQPPAAPAAALPPPTAAPPAPPNLHSSAQTVKSTRQFTGWTIHHGKDCVW
jgi:hypothetical protein